MKPGAEKDGDKSSEKRKRLRCGFSTGTAATAAARAALRLLLTGRSPSVVAVRLPLGYYLPVFVDGCGFDGLKAWARVIKDGGDDPDVTHRAEIKTSVRCSRNRADGSRMLDGITGEGGCTGICVLAGKGVGVVTRRGLPAAVGEPAVNPVPREMLARNLVEELKLHPCTALPGHSKNLEPCRSATPHILLPFGEPFPGSSGLLVEVEIEVPRGVELARHTLNPRLGVAGGISILGTTGIVKPFSHEAYEDTVRVSLSVAASAGCRQVVLATGGKSEKLAGRILSELPPESFVQIADFFDFSVREAFRKGFRGIIHSAFFGKVVKMAQGHPYTHAHTVPLDLGPLADAARRRGFTAGFCDEIRSANTARHALELLLEQKAMSVIEDVSREALRQSAQIAGDACSVRLLLFDYSGNLLADVTQ